MQPLELGEYTLCDLPKVAQNDYCANGPYPPYATEIQETVARKPAQSCYAQGLIPAGDNNALDSGPGSESALPSDLAFYHDPDPLACARGIRNALLFELGTLAFLVGAVCAFRWLA